MMDDINSWVNSHLAKAYVLEQVLGFVRPTQHGDTSTPFDECPSPSSSISELCALVT